MYIYTHIYIHIHIQKQIQVFFEYIQICIHMYTHTHTHAQMHFCLDIFMCIIVDVVPYIHSHGVATISRLLKIIGLFCKRALQKRPVFSKETYNFKEPSTRSHPIEKERATSKHTAHTETHTDTDTATDTDTGTATLDHVDAHQTVHSLIVLHTDPHFKFVCSHALA